MRMPPCDGRLAIVTGTPGELHALGARMVGDFLEADGWEVIQLGASTPAPDLAELVDRERPDVIALSTATAGSLPGIVDVLDRLGRLEPRPFLVVGGQFWTAETSRAAHELGADLALRDLRLLVPRCASGCRRRARGDQPPVAYTGPYIPRPTRRIRPTRTAVRSACPNRPGPQWRQPTSRPSSRRPSTPCSRRARSSASTSLARYRSLSSTSREELDRNGDQPLRSLIAHLQSVVPVRPRRPFPREAPAVAVGLDRRRGLPLQ